jgi:protein SCO1/2
MRGRMRRRACLVALAGALLGVAVARADVPESVPAPPRFDRLFALTTGDGARFAAADVAGKWVMVYFGYTLCPDMCPTAMLQLAQVLERLGPLAARIQPLFVTIDPGRDDGPALRQYVNTFDARILPLTGSPAAVRAAAQAFHVFYTRYQDPSLRDYSLDHSSYIFLIDPARRLSYDFAEDAEPDEMVALIRPLLSR